ncbi:hypothetical protein ANCDUO_09595 [Ancylostoma duodenale]|uniref:Uncharacterized protein n=1 Tax=Ancylostoma duodenale TaxID=51022 RepID=A0A0C2GMD2_9BILA|nr:hypothetical protein ANCDUO_09595 [Ancylostoma duodenale]
MEADIEFVAPCQREIDAYIQNNMTVFAYSFDYIPESPIFEEEKKTFNLFGRDPVTILRKDQALKGNILLHLGVAKIPAMNLGIKK